MKRNIWLLSLIFISLSLTALDVPKLQGRVNDYAGVISAAEERTIENRLETLERSNGVQLAVLTVPSLEGDSLEGFTIRVAEEWQLGQKGEDNGILLFLAYQEKKIRIEVGYGLEGTLTDAKSGYIIREQMAPEFRSGDFAGGIEKAVIAIAGVVDGSADITQKTMQQSESRSSSVGIPFNFIIFLIILVLSSLSRRGRRRGGLWNLLFWSSILGGRGRGGGFGSGGGGGFSGGGGGGFSGGGGSFGGGGSSGGW